MDFPPYRLGEPVKDKCNDPNYYGNMQITETRGFTRGAGWGAEAHKSGPIGLPMKAAALSIVGQLLLTSYGRYS